MNNIRSIDAPYDQGETVKIFFDLNKPHLVTTVTAGDITFKIIGMVFHEFTEKGIYLLPKQVVHGKITYTYDALNLNHYGEIHVKEFNNNNWIFARNPVYGVILHNESGPAFIEIARFDKSKTLTYVEFWMQNGKMHRKYAPASTNYSSVNAPLIEFWEDDLIKYDFQMENETEFPVEEPAPPVVWY